MLGDRRRGDVGPSRAAIPCAADGVKRMLRSARRIAIISTLVLVGCGGDGDGGPKTSPSDVVNSPERFFGEGVTLETKVSNPIDHRVWEVAGGRLFVIYDRGLERGLQNGERLLVRGTVWPLERHAIEGELGVNIEDHFFDDAFLDDDVAIVADHVSRIQGR
jgi:hypothetical protein